MSDKNKQNVIVNFSGRMANQMFQWAFGRAYEKKQGIKPQFDNSQETIKIDCFKLMKDIELVKKPLVKKIFRKIIFIRSLRNKLSKVDFKLSEREEKCFCQYEPELLEQLPPVYFKGYFQTEKYFTNIREQLLKDFELNLPLNNANKEVLEKIKSTEAVAVHFRRGDYTKKRVSDKYGSCSVEYYKNAVKLIAEKTGKNLTVFVFSDDINWVKQNAKFDCETVYVDINSGKQGYFDLELMKNCKHNVIANSSFSWWGAWLNQNPEKVIVAPKTWMKVLDNDYDIIPESWLRIEN